MHRLLLAVLMVVVCLLQIPPANTDELQKSIDGGATVTAPQHGLSLGRWQGLGLIEENSLERSFRCMIEDIAGGDTGGNPPPPMPPLQQPSAPGLSRASGGTSCGDPVSVANGNFSEQAVDSAVRGPDPPLGFQRTYNSLTPTGGPARLRLARLPVR